MDKQMDKQMEELKAAVESVSKRLFDDIQYREELLKRDAELREAVIEVMRGEGFDIVNTKVAQLANEMLDHPDVTLDDFIIGTMFGTAIVALNALDENGAQDVSDERRAQLLHLFSGITSLATGIIKAGESKDAPKETV